MEDLERLMERGQLFVHDRLSRSFARQEETEAFLYGLIDVLLTKGIMQEEELSQAIDQIRLEQTQRAERVGPGIAMRQDKPEEAEKIEVVDCAARMHICHSICCKLHFALTTSEVEAGKIKWELGQPYFIRQNEEGYCVHRQADTGFCGAYADRPGICRYYSCAKDSRIWSNFEQMELNTAWLAEHLQGPDETMGNLEYQQASPQSLIQVTRRTKS